MKHYLWAAVLLLVPASAFAQADPGPFGGFFGREPQRIGVSFEGLELRGSGGWQWNDLLSDTPVDQPQLPFAGAGGYAAAAVSYNRQSDRLDLRAGTNVEFRNSFTDSTRGTTVDGGFFVNSRVTTRLSTEAGLSYRRSPFYQLYPTFSWTADGVIVPGLPYDMRNIGYHSGEGRVGASLQYSKSSTVSGSVSRSQSWLSTSAKSDVAINGYEGLWTRRLNRSFLVRLGYGHREFRYQTTSVQRIVEEEIDLGVDFHRALTISPRTTVGFMTHTSIVRRPDRKTLYRLNGDIHLTRQFQRTWKLELEARRATEVLAGFIEPLFTDSLGLSMSGLVTPRVEFVAMLVGKHGRFAYEGQGGPVAMAGATTHLNVAISRRFGFYTQYGFYYHEAPADAFAFTTLGEMSRQTLTAGITTWLPLYTRERTSLGSR